MSGMADRTTNSQPRHRCIPRSTRAAGSVAYSWPPPLVEPGGYRPTDQIFFCIPMPLNRRLVGAINIFVVFLFRIRAIIRISWQSLYVPPLLSGSGSHHRDYDQRRVDGFAQHDAIPSEVANLSYFLPVRARRSRRAVLRQTRAAGSGGADNAMLRGQSRFAGR